MEANEHGTVVPRALVVKIAENFRELALMHMQEKAIMAEMIRGCIAKIRQDVNTSPAYRRAEGWNAQSKARKEHAREQAQAWLHLEWLATQLENQSGVPSAEIDLTHQPLRISAP